MYLQRAALHCQRAVVILFDWRAALYSVTCVAHERTHHMARYVDEKRWIVWTQRMVEVLADLNARILHVVGIAVDKNRLQGSRSERQRWRWTWLATEGVTVWL